MFKGSKINFPKPRLEALGEAILKTAADSESQPEALNSYVSFMTPPLVWSACALPAKPELTGFPTTYTAMTMSFFFP